jgi:hypothetical protein
MIDAAMSGSTSRGDARTRSNVPNASEMLWASVNDETIEHELAPRARRDHQREHEEHVVEAAQDVHHAHPQESGRSCSAARGHVRRAVGVGAGRRRAPSRRGASGSMAAGSTCWSWCTGMRAGGCPC